MPNIRKFNLWSDHINPHEAYFDPEKNSKIAVWCIEFALNDL